MGGVVSEQRHIESKEAIVSITYRTEKDEVKTYTIDVDVHSLYGLYIEPRCKDLDELYSLHQVYMARLLDDLSKIEAKIAGFIEIGKDIVDGKIIPENFDYELMAKKNAETKKEYNTFLYLIAEETKKDNIKEFIVLGICYGFLAAVAIGIISLVVSVL